MVVAEDRVLRGAQLFISDKCMGIHETLQYMYFPDVHWRHIRTNNPLERVMREIRRRTRVVGNFPNGNSALMLVAARLRHIAGSTWGTRRYLNTDLLRNHTQEEQASKETMPVESHQEKRERIWTLPTSAYDPRRM